MTDQGYSKPSTAVTASQPAAGGTFPVGIIGPDGTRVIHTTANKIAATPHPTKLIRRFSIPTNLGQDR
ncbi:MAG: hypothetical protein SynsKO_38030 [Synoicihabitans sp.]